MKNKKGFTLIEIIICIALIAIIGTGSIITINIINKNKAENNIKLYDTLAEAASIYINIEKDEQGNTYENGLYYGGNGVVIPIDELYNKGYIGDNIITTLEKDKNYKNAKEDNKQLYLLAAVFSNDSIECKGEVIEYKSSWNADTDTGMKYICSYQIDHEILNKIRYIIYDLDGGKIADPTFKKANIVKKNEELRITNLSPAKDGYTFTGWKDENGNNFSNNQIVDNSISTLILTAQYSKNPAPEDEPTIFNKVKKDYEAKGISGCRPNLENGICLAKGPNQTKDSKPVYYYTGNVDNNVVDINGTKFYIVRTTEEGDVKLVAKDHIYPIAAQINKTPYTWNPNDFSATLINKNEFMDNHIIYHNYPGNGVYDNNSTKILGSWTSSKNAYSYNYYVFNNKLYEIGEVVTNGDADATYSSGSYSYVNVSKQCFDCVNDNKQNSSNVMSKCLNSGICQTSNPIVSDWGNTSNFYFYGKQNGYNYYDTLSLRSYLYQYIYRAVENWYKNIQTYDRYVINYNWCDYSNYTVYETGHKNQRVEGTISRNNVYKNYQAPNFTCKSTNTTSHSYKFGLLTLAEINAIINLENSFKDDNMHSFSKEGSYASYLKVQNGDLSYDFYAPENEAIYLNPNTNTHSHSSPVASTLILHPSIVIDGDTKVSGNGKAGNPYKIVS